MEVRATASVQIMFSNWWMVAIVLAGMTVYHIVYDQTEKVKGVMTTKGMLLPAQLPSSESRNYTRQLADARIDEHKKSQSESIQKSL